MAFAVPTRKNLKLRALVRRIEADQELVQLWKCANINAADRGGISDHGESHVRIVADAHVCRKPAISWKLPALD